MSEDIKGLLFCCSFHSHKFYVTRLPELIQFNKIIPKWVPWIESYQKYLRGQ